MEIRYSRQAISEKQTVKSSKWQLASESEVAWNICTVPVICMDKEIHGIEKI